MLLGMIYNPTQPYNDLPLLPPLSDLETKPVLKLCTKANRALAELKGQLNRIPNPSIMTNTLTLQEARMSSEVENIVTTQDDLFKAAADPSGAMNSPTKEVLRYREAIWHGYYALKDANQSFSTRLFIEVAQQVRGVNIDVRSVPGTQLANIDKAVIYTPPVGKNLLLDKLTNLCQFYNETALDFDPLIKMAVGHYQFEAIHPFTDGNGRTGRILNILYLIDQGLIDWPVLYLSRYIIQNKIQYYNNLRAVTEAGEWEAWILYILKGVEETATQALEQVNAIVELMYVTRQKIKKELPKIYTHELTEVLFENPYCKNLFLVNKGIAKRQTASQYLRALVEIGVLSPVKFGREVYYMNSALMAVLRSR